LALLAAGLSLLLIRPRTESTTRAHAKIIRPESTPAECDFSPLGRICIRTGKGFLDFVRQKLDFVCFCGAMADMIRQTSSIAPFGKIVFLLAFAKAEK
jgi:hypothetical protein